MNRKEANCVCMECGDMFRRAPSSQLQRCKHCRGGKQGKRVGVYRKEVVEDGDTEEGLEGNKQGEVLGKEAAGEDVAAGAVNVSEDGKAIREGVKE